MLRNQLNVLASHGIAEQKITGWESGMPAIIYKEIISTRMAASRLSHLGEHLVKGALGR